MTKWLKSLLCVCVFAATGAIASVVSADDGSIAVECEVGECYTWCMFVHPCGSCGEDLYSVVEKTTDCCGPCYTSTYTYCLPCGVAFEGGETPACTGEGTETKEAPVDPGPQRVVTESPYDPTIMDSGCIDTDTSACPNYYCCGKCQLPGGGIGDIEGWGTEVCQGSECECVYFTRCVAYPECSGV